MGTEDQGLKGIIMKKASEAFGGVDAMRKTIKDFIKKKLDERNIKYLSNEATIKLTGIALRGERSEDNNLVANENVWELVRILEKERYEIDSFPEEIVKMLEEFLEKDSFNEKEFNDICCYCGISVNEILHLDLTDEQVEEWSDEWDYDKEEKQNSEYGVPLKSRIIMELTFIALDELGE